MSYSDPKGSPEKEHHAKLVQGLSNWQSEQQVQLQHLLHLEFRVQFWLLHSCVQFAVPTDWEAPGSGTHPIGKLD